MKQHGRQTGGTRQLVRTDRLNYLRYIASFVNQDAAWQLSVRDLFVTLNIVILLELAIDLKRWVKRSWLTSVHHLSAILLHARKDLFNERRIRLATWKRHP